MYPALARIVLRYAIGGLLGALVALGALAPEVVPQIVGDKDLEFVIAAGLPVAFGAATEFWYWAAKRYGWPT
jgi:O-antigen/teichoic acid export membrane protein